MQRRLRNPSISQRLQICCAAESGISLTWINCNETVTATEINTCRSATILFSFTVFFQWLFFVYSHDAVGSEITCQSALGRAICCNMWATYFSKSAQLFHKHVIRGNAKTYVYMYFYMGIGVKSGPLGAAASDMSFFILPALSLVWADMMEDEKTQSLTPHRAPRMDQRMNQKPTSRQKKLPLQEWWGNGTRGRPWRRRRKSFLHDTSYLGAYILCKMRLELASSVAEEWATHTCWRQTRLCATFMQHLLPTGWHVTSRPCGSENPNAWTYQRDDVSHWFWHRSEPSRDCQSDLICVLTFLTLNVACMCASSRVHVYDTDRSSCHSIISERIQQIFTGEHLW